MYRGLMLTNAMLSSERDPVVFSYGIEALKGYDLQLIEYYTKDDRLAKEYGKIVQDNGYIGIFHSALDQKRSGWCRLCAEDEDVRKRSVDFSKWTIEKAVSAGAIRAVMQSGTYPEDAKNEVKCWEALSKSLRELTAFAGDSITLSIEPCDRSADVRQLIGPALATYTFMRKLNEPIVLTLDTAHIVLNFESPVEAVKLCRPFCDHVHIANCSIKPEAAIFGDKHPLFGHPDGAMSDAEAQKMFKSITDFYGEGEMYISTEMICREPDERAYFKNMLKSMPWFFQKKE